MLFIEVFYYSLVFAAGGLVSYYLFISLLALRANRDINHEAVKTRKFAVILFTHGKEQILSRLLYSLSGLVYPKNKYDLIVVADSYSDSIVQVAEKMGAQIMIPPAGKRNENKNNILSWAFDSILQGGKPYDAVIIFDSDGLVSGNYLEVMNFYLEQGSEVIQCGFNNLLNAESWVDKIREIDFLIDRFVYPMGRKILGRGINIRSNGICFSTALLRAFPWKSEEQPGIIEYGLALRLNGVEIDFTSTATVFAKGFPINKDKNSYSGNRNAGNYQLIRKYMPRVFSKTVKTKSFKYVDMLLELASPQFANLMLFVLAIGVIHGILWWGGLVSLSALLLWLLIIGVALTTVYVALTVIGEREIFLRSVMYIPITFYIKVQDFIKKYRSEEQAIVVPDEKDKCVAVSDENHPMQ
jgi:hypothetical protein